MRIGVSHNIHEAARRLERLPRQLQFGTSIGLTRTVQQARDDVYGAMRSVFDRPTPYTLRALRIFAARRELLQARIVINDDGSFGTGGVPPDVYLSPQIEGGVRRQKRFEVRLRRMGLLGVSEVTVPGAGARLDRYGNVSRGQIVQILSQLGSVAFDGDYSTATNSKRSRAKRARVAYFVSRGKGSWFGRRSWKNGEKEQHLPRGIWARYAFALGTAVKPVLLFVEGASYSKRLDFYGVVRSRVEQSLLANVDAGIRQALESAR